MLLQQAMFSLKSGVVKVSVFLKVLKLNFVEQTVVFLSNDKLGPASDRRQIASAIQLPFSETIE